MFHAACSAVKCIALVPFGVGDGEGPGLEILGGFPFAGEVRPGDVVDAGAGHVAADLAHDVGVHRPTRKCGDCRAWECACAILMDPALRNVLRHAGGGDRLAGDLARPHIGGARRHAEQRRVADEFAPVDFLVRQLLLQLRNPDMFFIRHSRFSSHGQIGPIAVDLSLFSAANAADGSIAANRRKVNRWQCSGSQPAARLGRLTPPCRAAPPCAWR